MSNQKVMDQFFKLLKETIDRLDLTPDQIFNCDETGWSGKEKSRQRVVGIKGRHSYQQSSFTPGHVTAHLCICADGRILPSLLIFEKSLPHTTYKDCVPGNWMFGYTDSGYMDGKLFVSWFENIFIPFSGKTRRPALLILDNHDSHITLDVIDMAVKNQIELLALPPHTTHILQPLDVHINGPLKAKVTSVASKLGHLNKHQMINKARFPVVLSYSIDQFCSPARVKETFRKTGICPYDPEAIDKTQLVESHSVRDQSSSEPVQSTSAASDSVHAPSLPASSHSQTNNTEPVPGTSEASDSMHAPPDSICTKCGTFLGGNPLVTEGLIPKHLADIFQAIPCNSMITTSRKLVTESRIITNKDFIKKLSDKMEEDKKKKEELAKRKEEREKKKFEKEAEKAERIKNKDGKRNKNKQKQIKQKQQQNVYLCQVCNLSDPADLSDKDTEWVACEACDKWVHVTCAGLDNVTDLNEIAYYCPICLDEE